MARFYHGSLSRYLVDGAAFHVRHYLRTRKARSSARRRLPAQVFRRLRRYGRFVARRDWDNLRVEALALAQYAEQHRDELLLREMVEPLLGLGEYRRAFALDLVYERLRHGVRPNEWDGSAIPDRHLLLSLSGNDIGTLLLYAVAVPHAMRRAAQTTVVIHPRLLKLFARSFASANVIPTDAEDRVSAYDAYGRSKHLGAYILSEIGGKDYGFTPLLPDRALVRAIRDRYRQSGDGPLIGISWGSKNHHKIVPGFADWRKFMCAVPATYVSLQYGNISQALRRLRRNMHHPLIFDDSIDQLQDMDLFAAQVAAMDAVITIPNTCAHLTGALGVPGVLIQGGDFGRKWPVVGEGIPWYPKLQPVRREARQWSAVFDAAGEKLRSAVPALR
ncbi:MAG: hypothetical protein R3229_01820 [Alphaproteobacteria bacterium]|nr:hypothetical protein [Alphaproteobacteria bacterium]